MPTNKEQLVEEIASCRNASLNDIQITRKIFLLDPAFIFKDHRIEGFQILNSIAEKFRIALGCVKIVGSSQTGFSPFKGRDFRFAESDLDIAIVSPALFQRYCEIVYEITNGYRNLTQFKDADSRDQFEENLKVGFFRPDLMPQGKEKADWFLYFNSLTARYSTIFNSINGGIYFSERFFEGKQLEVVKLLK